MPKSERTESEAALDDQISAIKQLAKQNSIYRLNSASARTIAEALPAGDTPLVVLPMRDVWGNDGRLPGLKPVVCCSEQRLVATSKPLFATKLLSWNSGDIASLSGYDNRTFEIRYRDGTIVKMRGLIGDRKGEAMTLRLYSALESMVARSA